MGPAVVPPAVVPPAFTPQTVIPSEARDLACITKESGGVVAYCVYILASKSRRLYTGVTRNLPRRVAAHRLGTTPGFTTRYRIDRLVHFECGDDVRAALRREKQVKAWSRAKRVALIERNNAGRLDLSAGWDLPPPAH
jgi:putative endonuclease